MVYELLGMTGGTDAEIEARSRDMRLSRLTWEASGYFEKRDFSAAASRYRKILEEFPGDTLANKMLEACSHSPSIVPSATFGADKAVNR
jgi:adenylate cyclase